MSTRELTRAGVLARVAAGTLRLGSAAAVMAVSYRQAKRLYQRYRAEGARGLKHRSAGRRSNAARDAGEREHILAVVREEYSGAIDERFGPTLAAEHLASEDGVHVHHDTLRRWMLAAGLWSRARKRSPHRRRRERKAHFGELVQLDGSFHPWFERRGPQSCLLTMVDDATGRSFGTFGAQETIWAAAGVLGAWIERHGIPRALYTDWKNVYVRPPNQEERATGAEPLTQFGRMCAIAGDHHHPRELASGQGSDRTSSRHASGSLGQKAPPPRDCRCGRRECISTRRRTGPTTTAASRVLRPRRMTSTSRSHARLSLATGVSPRRNAHGFQ